MFFGGEGTSETEILSTSWAGGNLEGAFSFCSGCGSGPEAVGAAQVSGLARLATHVEELKAQLTSPGFSFLQNRIHRLLLMAV